VVADAAFAHEGTAARLVHNLKYRRSIPAGGLLARSMERHLHPAASALVPLPRAVGRTLTYGIDPALSLARHLGARSGLPVVNALDGPLWWRRRAGRSRRDRKGVGFRLRVDPEGHVVLIDDVLTTGETAASAIRAFGRSDISILTATSAGTM
jgi:predicted amidophosphoribosyltransferase